MLSFTNVRTAAAGRGLLMAHDTSLAKQRPNSPRRSPKSTPVSSQPHMHQQLQQLQTPGAAKRNTGFMLASIPHAKAGLLPGQACALSAIRLPVREATASRTSGVTFYVTGCLEYWTMLDSHHTGRVPLAKNCSPLKDNSAHCHVRLSHMQCQILRASWGHAPG